MAQLVATPCEKHNGAKEPAKTRKERQVNRSLAHLLVALLATGLVMAGCAQAAPSPAPTKAPASPTKVAEPTKAAPAQVVPTKVAVPTEPVVSSSPQSDFPAKGKNLTVIVPFAAGGGSDILVRALTPVLERELGIPVVTVNRAGAATQVGTTELVKSKPDGYTVGIATLITTAVTYMDPERKAAYTQKDFQPVANLVVEDMVITAKADSPFKTVKDLVAAAKASPGQLKLGTTGLMGIGHLTGLALQQEAGAEFAYVHFDGAAPAATALLGGHVDVACTGAGAMLGHVKSGALRVLGYLDNQPSKFFPEVKTIDAQGYNVVVPAAYGVIAPAGTSKAVVDILSKALKTAVENEDVVKRLADVGFTPRYMNPTQFGAYWADREKQAVPLIELAKGKS